MVTESHSAAAVDDYPLHRFACELYSNCISDEVTAVSFASLDRMISSLCEHRPIQMTEL